MAKLFGMTPAPVERCRVLELGCGDGWNLIPMAFTLPESEFLGVDLAAAPIARGCDIISALELKNVRLVALNIMDFDGAFGEFDYIVAHGLYAWVPEPVRDKILAIAKAHLSPQGVAFVSYNTNPAGRMRQVLREMMTFHAGSIENPLERVEQGRALLELIAVCRHEPDVWLDLMRHQVASLAGRPAEVVYYDEFAEVYAPVYFHEFAAHAARQGLQYLSEAQFAEMQAEFAEPEAQQKLRELSGGDVLRYEQYLDFAKFRKFRQTLLCHAGITLDRSLQPARLRGLFVSSAAVQVTPPSGASPDTERFEIPNGPGASTNNPVVKSVLRRLIDRWPQSVRFEDLTPLADEQVLAEVLLTLYGATLVEFHACQPPIAAEAGPRPEASRLARLQARTQRLVTTLRHSQVEISDDTSRHVLQLLDGTRDRNALLDALATHCLSTPRATLAAQLEQNLAELVRLGLLVDGRS